jgi:hypothetical protein
VPGAAVGEPDLSGSVGPHGPDVAAVGVDDGISRRGRGRQQRAGGRQRGDEDGA